MTEDQENQDEEESSMEKEEPREDQDDLDIYVAEMKNLETDFSDLEDLDLEELQEMQDAIAKVKELENLQENEITEEEISKEYESFEVKTQTTEREEYLMQKEAMISDFSDIENIDFDELQEMQKAIETVKQEEAQTTESITTQYPASSVEALELEERIKQELLERKQEFKKEIITPEKFLERTKNKRDKIWYHSLHYLVYQAEDHIASKGLLYEMLKEVTSKSPIDPIPENQFYFGLGYILRLTLNEKQVVKYIRGGKLKINIGIKGISDILDEVGEPISTRPILKEEEKKEMYKEFLNDDFFDQF
jgi:chemotaxis protein histidine kinase CheA